MIQNYLSDWHGVHGAAHAVVLPESTAQVSAIMAYAAEHNIVVVPQGEIRVYGRGNPG